MEYSIYIIIGIILSIYIRKQNKTVNLDQVNYDLEKASCLYKQEIEDRKLESCAFMEAQDMFTQYRMGHSILIPKPMVSFIMIYPGQISKFSEPNSYRNLVNLKFKGLKEQYGKEI